MTYTYLAGGELQVGSVRQLNTNVTTDHVDHSWAAPPPGGPPPRDRTPGHGGGDEHLPSRLQILIAKAAVTAGALLLATAIVGVLEALKGAR